MPVESSYVNVIDVGGATGNGSTDDTAAIQSAIDQTPNDGTCYFPDGRYSVNRLNVPHNKAINFKGSDPHGATLINRTPGQDIFRVTDPGSASVQDRFNRVHKYQQLGFVLNTGSGSPDLTNGFDRCTTAGLPVGPCCIAYERSFVPTGTGNPGINQAWMHSFGEVDHCVVNVTGKHGNHGCGFIHHTGNHYGWTYNRMWIEGGHYGVTDSLPWVRRVTFSASSDRFTVQNGANPFRNGQTLFVTAHSLRGSLPGGFTRFRKYFVVNRNGTSFQLANTSGGGAINGSSNGSGSMYVHGAGDFAGEYSPDGVTIDKLTHYSGRCGISVTNTENLHIGRSDSYQMIAALHLYAVESQNRKEHIGPVVDAFYSESPQSTPMPAGEDIAHIDARGGCVGYLQIRGASAGTVRPPVRFKGEGYRVNCLDAISSLSQAQPDIEIDGNNIGVFGVAHPNVGLSDNGVNNYYLIARDGGGPWLHQSASPFA